MKTQLIMCAFIAVIIVAACHIGRNTTESVPFRWYAYLRGKDFRKGDYIIFKEQADPLHVLPKGAKLVKQAACTEGMELVTTDKDFICDGEYISKRIDPEKMSFSFAGKIPTGKVFVLGTHKRSYDSRIWGLLDESNIIGTVYPLF